MIMKGSAHYNSSLSDISMRYIQHIGQEKMTTCQVYIYVIRSSKEDSLSSTENNQSSNDDSLSI
uniref:Uncharacterized protein n=1 Tax=Arion vulgaris TaxID=1028688 RepID=A0A0B7AN58_9EUPU